MILEERFTPKEFGHLTAIKILLLIMTINNDIFPELNHEIIKPLLETEDILLWKSWQKYPIQARYLILLFYRYLYLTQTSSYYSNRIENQEFYLEKLWFFIFDNLLIYDIEEEEILSQVIINLIQEFFTEENIIFPDTNNCHFDFQLRYLPLKYYLEKSLEKLTPIERIILVTKDKFVWEDDKILQYLQQQKKKITLPEIKAFYTKAHSQLLNNLPTDIVSIYL